MNRLQRLARLELRPPAFVKTPEIAGDPIVITAADARAADDLWRLSQECPPSEEPIYFGISPADVAAAELLVREACACVADS